MKNFDEYLCEGNAIEYRALTRKEKGKEILKTSIYSLLMGACAAGLVKHLFNWGKLECEDEYYTDFINEFDDADQYP